MLFNCSLASQVPAVVRVFTTGLPDHVRQEAGRSGSSRAGKGIVFLSYFLLSSCPPPPPPPPGVCSCHTHFLHCCVHCVLKFHNTYVVCQVTGNDFCICRLRDLKRDREISILLVISGSALCISFHQSTYLSQNICKSVHLKGAAQHHASPYC